MAKRYHVNNQPGFFTVNAPDGRKVATTDNREDAERIAKALNTPADDLIAACEAWLQVAQVLASPEQFANEPKLAEQWRTTALALTLDALKETKKARGKS